MKKHWWMREVAYQIYPRSFADTNNDGIGDLRGIIEKLAYLSDLGITLIWLSPMYPSPMADNGYDISDYYGISEAFGTMDDFDDLLAAAKTYGIKIILDLVVNHTSDEHAWFQELLADPNSPYRDYYILKQGKDLPTNWRSNFGGSVWEKLPNGEPDTYYFHSFHKKQPDLNWENPKLRQEIYQMILFWLNKGISGFRVDAINFIKKDQKWQNLPADGADGLAKVTKAGRNIPGMNVFLDELKAEAFDGFDVVTVAEAAGVAYSDLPEFIGESGYFDMIFDFKWADIDVKSGSEWFRRQAWTIADLRELIMTQQLAMQVAGWSANFIENHDQPRATTKYLGEAATNLDAVKTLGAMYFFLRGTPFIYQGQELGMTNFKRSDISEFDDISSIDQYYRSIKEGLNEQEALSVINLRSRDNSRTPFPWTDAPNGGFSKVSPWLSSTDNFEQINAAHALENPDSLYYFYKRMIAFRQEDDSLIYGDFSPIMPKNATVIAYKRLYKGKITSAYFNLRSTDVVEVITGRVNKLTFETQENAACITDNTLTLKAYSGVLFTEMEL
ncbi:MAG: alpha-glucosidase [Lactococcus sp.]|uniref:alpha-glucosidase n=1 Tax=Pseudolactococcus carnosus TaxID=2749961 RepID=UPI0030B8F4F2|nr:alpha-glucosidase [Lactococcus sp.]MCJ2001407.1 alpha-glucosidase [Lactococcus carnosus]